MRTLLVSHNAGGAALLAAWAAHQSPSFTFDCLLSGPAVNVFCQRLDCGYLIAQDSVVLARYTSVITSTSSAETAWETAWIARAAEQKINTISLLDHWTNYTSRFLLNNKLVFPDELWVCDDYAVQLAQECQIENPNYPSAQKVTNFYLKDQVEYIHAHSIANATDERILFVSEPSYNPIYTATGVLEDFLQLVERADNYPQLIRLRLHPREQVEDYTEVCKRWNGKLNLELSPNTRLEDDLCWSNWVVGCQTMAMVVALAAGIKVASCLPSRVQNSALPHREIPRLFPPEEQ